MESYRAPPYNALEVGNSLVRQYYEILQHHPEVAFKFYKDISTMSYIDGIVVNTAIATAQIHSLIMSLNFTGIEIRTAHSMESFNDGILIMISGSTWTQECEKRRIFVQTFFLAPQKTGYFIISDILQLMHKDITSDILPQPPAFSLSPGSYFSDVKVSSRHVDPVTEHISSTKIQDGHSNSILHLNEHKTTKKYRVFEPTYPINESVNRLKLVIEEPSTVSRGEEDLSIVQSIVKPVSEPIKHTYASILRIPKVRREPSESHLNSTTFAPNHQAEVQPLVVHHPHDHVASEGLPLEDVPEIRTLEAEEYLVTSVYVKNLPPSVTTGDLEVLFQNFGKIKPHGVYIKSQKETGFYYGFVNFEDTQCVENAIKESPLLFHGFQIYVERCRQRYGAPLHARRSTRNGRFSRGRSGFQVYGRMNLQEGGETRYFGRPYGNEFRHRGGHLGRRN